VVLCLRGKNVFEAAFFIRRPFVIYQPVSIAEAFQTKYGKALGAI